MSRTLRLAILLAVATLGGGRLLAAEKIRNHFDADAPLRAPGFFDLVVLGDPAPADWKVLVDRNPPSTANKLGQVVSTRPAGSIAAAVRRTYSFRDGLVSVYMRRAPTREGVLLRMADEKNFLVLLVDMTSGEAVLRSFRNGEPMELGRGRAALARDWEMFAVRASGPTLTVLFGDQKLFEAKDPKPVAGRVGVATEGPGEASFDELVLEPQE